MVDADDGAGPSGPLDGISGNLGSKYTVLSMFVILFLSLALYNAIELIVLVLLSFKRFRGLYFWSLLLSGLLGVVPYSVGFILKFFSQVNVWVSVSILTVGWWVMVTGQSLVLYSRLHLVMRDQKRLRRLLYMIMVNFVILHLPTSVLTYGSNVHNATSSRFINGYNIMEKIQMTGFSIQETVISGFYLYETARLLRLSNNSHSHRRTQYQLIGINIIIILMDLVLLGFEYASEYAIQITLKAAVYSLKLKLEFAVLGKLVDFIRTNRDNSRSGMPMDSTAQRYAGQDAGLPSTRADDAHFYGKSTATVMRRDPSNSSEEHLNIPSGIIVAKTEFSTTIDKRDRSSLNLDDSD
ncbi:hypothetical protein BGW36DRAFT_286062 [Talaromyces proteolyticus]|uniref:DUF7703 domain-containing protein n=1 Tax=Talaromyces proteolyticus TaxID=1131652 RepID=A0AAD4Q6L8_9EURO|nr:uncharacterized protein BGW36DRAFT_286062 [Talaromyces proteolyticus]KAH8705778.1 hypothetical protein BGW36DRAFT_286062 [Talaromyces proteolyticus]